MHIYRSIQIGRLPVLVYDDLPWAPYPNTTIAAESFGFVYDKNSMPALIDRIRNMTETEYQERVQHMIREVRPYYTYPGIMTQISLFLQDPFGSRGGYLRCTTHPRTERCCG